VRFLGHVDPESALRRWDVLVSASVSPEAGPLSVLEAMSYGVPVVGTDHGGTTEFLRDGAGLLVAPDDAAAMAAAIDTLLRDDRLRRNVIAAAMRRITNRHDLTMTLPSMLRNLLG
jgi:glycosyltransferase involved in cell wall biosynthesis